MEIFCKVTPYGLVPLYDSVTEHGATASLLRDEPTYYDRKEARKRVYKLNGWKYTKK